MQDFHPYIVGITIVLMVIALSKDLLRPGLIFYTAITIFMVFGIIDTKEALAGFSNKGMITIMILFLVSEGVRKTGVLSYLAQLILPKKKVTLSKMLLKTMIPISALSAFLNNTPVVMIFAPMIKKWAEKMNLPASKFLIPLSYATILGGLTTLIGTSTNLVVHGMMLEENLGGIGMFEIGLVGIPIAVVGFVYMSLLGNVLLPGTKVEATQKDRSDYRQYYFDVFVPEDSPLVGNSIVKKRNRLLKNFDVVSIIRDGKRIVTTNQRHFIRSNDSLVLAGKSDSVNKLNHNTAVELSCLESASPEFVKQEVQLVEVVLSPRFPGIGKTFSEFNFESHYNAIVTAVHRNGERISSNLDQLVLKQGDTLVLLASDNFLKNWGESRIFYATSYIGNFDKTKTKRRMWFALAIILVMSVATAFFRRFFLEGKEMLDMFFFASIAMLVMVWSKILPSKEYTKSISWDVIITIACAFGVSKAMINSGAADAIANAAVLVFQRFGPVGVLVTIYIMTNLFTEVITNNAAAALIFPIAYAAANSLGVDPKPYFIAICIAASASFSTPIGYQTNLIIQGMGNYKFRDYIRIGLPLNIICLIVAVILIPIMFPF